MRNNCRLLRIIRGVGGRVKRVANERLHSQAITRASSFCDTPYILAGDFNINLDGSNAIKAATEEGWLADVFKEWTHGQPSPTFCREGVYEGMNGTQKTRIDGILANRAAKAIISRAELRWSKSMGFDHVCMAVRFDIAACTQQIWRLRQPAAIDLDILGYGPKKGERHTRGKKE